MKFLTSLALCVSALSAVASALPSPSPDADGYGYGGTRGRRGRGRRDDDDGLEGVARAARTCNTKNLQKLQLPAAASGYTSTWTAPSPSTLKLARIVIGAGTQNYTCATPYSSSATPVANGAKASLYDFTCLAAALPPKLFDQYFHLLPRYFYDGNAASVSRLPSFLSAAGKVMGHHIFAPDASTPVFTIEQQGVFTGKKIADTPAPPEALQGEYGAVPWLELGRKSEAGSDRWERVYRVETQGGKAPPSCEGREATFEVEYATEYWFYQKK
ncbi:hypothetical protein EDC01DRAFT_462622 [Geopyxis carbonaria]|nr:hypothetical protein EDC01DRAFT_462622 [Geopyxis carbonaria]